MSSLGFRKRLGAVPSGTITGSAVAQINTRGVLDSFFYAKDPDIAFHRSELLRCGVFASEVVTQPLVGTMTYGTELSLLAHKTADLLSESYAMFVRPGIRAERAPGGSRPWGSRSSGRRNARFRKSKRAQRAPRRFPTRAPSVASSRASTPRSRQRTYYEDEDFDYSNTENLYNIAQYYDYDEEEEEEEEDEEEVFAHYVNSFGYAVIERATCSLAGMLAQTLTGPWLHAFAALTGVAMKEHNDVVGTYDTKEKLIEMSGKTMVYYVELIFSYARFSSRAHSLIGQRHHPMSISLALTELSNVIQVSHDDVVVINNETGNPLQHTDIKVSLDMTYVYLGTSERNRHMTAKMQCTWEQVQYVQKTGKGPSITIPLTLANPIRALIFYVQRKEADILNDTFDYGTGVKGEETVEYAQLLLNTTPRFSREGGFFRRLVPLKHFNRRLPEDMMLYAMCFGLDGHSEHINGTQNFSRLEVAQLVLDINERLHDQPYTAHVMAFSLNVYEMDEGTIQMLFQ